MKIAFVANKAWNIYNFRRGIVKTLLNTNCQVIVIAPEDESVPNLLAMGCQYIPLAVDSKGGNPFKDIYLIYRLYKAYKKNKPDVVLHFTIKPNIYGSFAAGLVGIPSAVTISGLGTTFLHSNFKTGLAKLLYRFSLRFSKKIIFQNEDDRILFITKKLTKSDKTTLVPGSGVDTTQYTQQPFKRHQPFRFLLIARLIEDKGIREYIEAIRLLRSKGVLLDCQLLGFTAFDDKLGISQLELESWIKEGLIYYLGPAEDVRPYMSEVDCIVLPSYREGTPRTLLEAAAMGKPLIATNAVGCKEIVEDGINGLLCQIKSATDLAHKLELMISFSDDKLIMMGKKSREKVERQFDEKIVIKHYIDFIKDIKHEVY